MTSSELSEKNFKRISITNWILSLPLIVLFAWPYLYICDFFEIEITMGYIGSLLFAVPFMTTILHGIVTMALGSVHRHHYYNWLARQALTYGLFFSPIFMRTRFRLALVTLSLMLLAISGIFNFE